MTPSHLDSKSGSSSSVTATPLASMGQRGDAAILGAEALEETWTRWEPWARALAQLPRQMALQDWLFFAYFGSFFGALVGGSGPNREREILRVGADIVVLFVGLLLSRGGMLRPGSFAKEAVYRGTIFGTVFLSYFQLQHILPAVSSRAVDGAIYALDLRLFGWEPAVAWDRFVNPTTTEWFAFFYFGYFAVLIVHIIPFLMVVRDSALVARFALGVYFVFCTAHVLYMVVPGFGPHRYLASTFQHPLEGGLFWHLVVQAVTGAGAQKDIFPSLHTAVPTYFFLFSFRHRYRLPFRYTWPIVGFVASQIIIATMFLRWHYLIDIVAGITLALTGLWVGDRWGAWEEERRQRLGLPPVFGKALFPRSDW